MELLQLKYFSALAHNGNLTKTAQMLYVSPSSLSATIARVERELGVKLFDRTGNRMWLNATGKQFLSDVDKALEILEQATTNIATQGAIAARTLRFAVTASNIWNDMFVAFREQFPEVIISQKVLHLSEITRSSMAKFDFLITSPTDVEGLKLDQIILYANDAPILLVHKNHPFAEYKSIDLCQARNEAFVCQPEDTTSRKYFDTLCKAAGFVPNIVAECDYLLREEMICNQVGIAVASGYTRRLMKSPDIRAIDVVSPSCPRAMGLYWEKGTELKPLHKQFQDFAVKYYADVQWKNSDPFSDNRPHD